MAKNEIVIKFLGDDSSFRKVAGSVDGQTSGLGSKLATFGKVAGAAFAGASVAAIAFGKSAIDAAAEAAKVSAQTDAVIKSTGGAAGVGAKAVGDLAHQLQNMSGVSDETIQSGQNMLLTFTNVQNRVGKGNDVFNQASKTMLDMSVALGTDAKTSALQLGKALNDPIAGIGALSRVGVTFTDQQKEQIKTMVKAGDVAGAQKVILAELNKEFGGSAKAAGDARTPMEKLSMQFGDIQEAVGTALLPVISKFADILMKNVGPALGFVGGLFKPLVDAFSAIKEIFATGDLTSGDTPFDPHSSFIQGVIWVKENVPPIVREVIDFISAKFQQVRDFISTVMPQIQEAVGHVISVIQTAWAVFGDDILRVAQEIWSQIQNVIETAIGVIEGVIQFALALINGDWGKAWDALKGIVSTVFEGIKATIGNAIGVIIGVLGGVGDAIRRVAHGMFDGIKDAFKSAINFIIRGWNNLQFKIPGFKVGPIGYDGFTLGVPDIPYLAKGGVVKASAGGTLALLGEAGQDEAVVPLSRSGLMGGLTVIVQTGQTLSTDRDIENAVTDALESFFSRGGALGDGRGRFLRPA